MESLRKGYQTRIREDMMSAAGESKIKLYQEYFQVKKRWITCPPERQLPHSCNKVSVMGRWCWVSANSGLYRANGYKQSAKKAAMTFDDVMGLSYVVAGCFIPLT
ncbi:PREDICTED: uncharacterized protein LOC107330995 isoform X1 [Acropora digitifera]|uniref:uncharacterized protein LOC107330995 isoform X1 n=1 Tax=Acropora digitifera TaxID=70779 RepID=UPI00077A2FCE|nr:PREDICTED: uncharacterized protein LOC107330995 isoform X1 [Acropora digitifera]